MTVYVAIAEKDRPTAEALEKFLERRGLFVTLEDGAQGFRPLLPSDSLIALWSKDTVFSVHRLALEKRCLDAWADGRLILCKLDHGIAPVGLRDLAAIDASFEPQRDIAWAAVAKAAQDLANAPVAPPMPSPSRSAPPQPLPAPAPARKAGAGWLIPFFLLMAAIVVGAGLWAMVNVFGAPGLPDMAPDLYQAALPIAGALAALLLIGVAFLVIGRKRPASASMPESASPGPAPRGDPLFVSYARADSSVVAPLVAAVEQKSPVWMDKNAIGAGDAWAGEIVRAIRGARSVVVMCSSRAFESDHVKRELYLADRYKKKLLPVFLEPAAPPEDFEYFFAGVQALSLHELPQDQRIAAVTRALGET
jgi:hypothetical protein